MHDQQPKRLQLFQQLIVLEELSIELMKLVSLDLLGSEVWAEAVQNYLSQVEVLRIWFPGPTVVKQEKCMRMR